MLLRRSSGTARLLLNTPGGTVELRTGEIRPHDRKDYLTKCTAVTPATGLALCGVLPRPIFDEDDQLIGFRAANARLRAHRLTEDHALFFLYGLGANGKSVFLDTVIGILERLSRVAPTEMLMASKHERHPTELASLVGRRLVTATETEGGKRWAEAKIKALTGGDKLPRGLCAKTSFSSRRSSSSSSPAITSRP